jgi:hypothetical protein
MVWWSIQSRGSTLMKECITGGGREAKGSSWLNHTAMSGWLGVPWMTWEKKISHHQGLSALSYKKYPKSQKLCQYLSGLYSLITVSVMGLYSRGRNFCSGGSSWGLRAARKRK